MKGHISCLLAAVAITFVSTGCQTLSSDKSIPEFGFLTLSATGTITGTALIPAPYDIDTSPTGEFGLNGKTWYIDGTNGNDSNRGTSESQAFSTIQKGVDSSGPGDKIYVMNGTYQFKKEGTPTANITFYAHSGTPAHWILFAACPGHHPKLEFSYYDCVSIQGSSHIIISGFTIQGPANMITLAEAQAHENSTDDFYYNGAGIVIFGLGDKPSTTHSDHIIVANNVVYNCSGAGIGVTYDDYITVRSNIVAYNAFWSPYNSSGIMFFAFWDSNPADTGIRNRISENLCFGNNCFVPFIYDSNKPKRITDGNGIIVDCFNLNGYKGRTIVENNICFDNGAAGININRSDHLIIRNNTLYYDVKSRDFQAGDLCFWNNHDNGEPIVSDITAMNNVVLSRNSMKGTVHACFIGTADDVSGFTFADNLFCGVGSAVGWGLTPGETLFPGTGTLIDVDPRFSSASTDPAAADFSFLAGSPALDKCTNGPATDFLGHPRPAGSSIDMGALERQ